MRHILRPLIAILLSFAIILPTAPYAEAKKRARKSSTQAYNPKYSDIVVDADTGKILHDDSSGALRHPASLTKMMTLYLLFEQLSQNKMRMSDRMSVSAEAASRPQTNMSLLPGDSIEVEDAIHALIIRSANDVAVVTAENIAGSEEAFARLMTQRARQLGMKNTTFKNASGLHNPGQITTARDMALLGIALKKHYPQYYHFFADTEFNFRGKTYTTHNRVMLNYPGADGLKTGFVTASGFNLVTSASRHGSNLVGVVLGGRSGALRDQRMMALLDDSFAKSSDYNFARKQRPTTYASAVPEVAQGDDSGNDTNQFPAQAAPASGVPSAPPTSSYITAQQVLNAPKATDSVAKKIKKKKAVKKKAAKKVKKKKKKSTAKKKSSSKKSSAPKRLN